MSEPWLEYPGVWKTKSSFMSWLRGGIRRSLWNRSPIKLQFISNNRKRITNPNKKAKVKEVWGGTCALCGVDYPTNQLNVDHKEGGHTLKELSDIQSFVEAIVIVSESDLQYVCKPCHKIKNQQEKKGISFEQARVEKIAIDLINKKMDKDWLKSKGVTPESNQKKRREQIIAILTEGG